MVLRGFQEEADGPPVGDAVADASTDQEFGPPKSFPIIKHYDARQDS